jgi:hypothetical protein
MRREECLVPLEELLYSLLPLCIRFEVGLRSLLVWILNFINSGETSGNILYCCWLVAVEGTEESGSFFYSVGSAAHRVGIHKTTFINRSKRTEMRPAAVSSIPDQIYILPAPGAPSTATDQTDYKPVKLMIIVGVIAVPRSPCYTRHAGMKRWDIIWKM